MDEHTTTKFSFLYFNLNKILTNSTPGKVACIWHIEQVQIDAIKFERTQIHFFSDVFTTVVYVVAYRRSLFTSVTGRIVHTRHQSIAQNHLSNM